MKLILTLYFILFSIVISAQCTGFPATIADADCGTLSSLTSGGNINSGASLGSCSSPSTVNSFTNINLSGGLIRVCGNTSLSGNFNSGTIIIACGATLNFPNGLRLNQNVGIINYGTVNITGNLTFENNNVFFYNESTSSQLYVSGDLSYPQNNGQNAYLKNNGYISIGDDFNARQGGFTCLGPGSRLICNDIRYINNCGGPNNRFTYSGGAGNATIQYRSTATIRANFTTSSSINVLSTAGASAINNAGCGAGSWGNASVTTNSPMITDPAMQDPSACIIQNCFTVLPITLVSFIAKLETDKVRLNWVTVSEINNDFFSIELSSDGINWKTVKDVNGAGNSNQLINYSAYDFNPLTGTSYYRLKQTDFDNTSTYSAIQAINNETQHFNIYPNPTQNKITVSGSTIISIELINLLGETVLKQKITTIEEDIILSEFPSGTYIAKIIREQDTFIKKIILQNEH